MKILFYDQFSLKFGGGGEIWLINVAQRLAKRGIDIQILTTSKVVQNAGPVSITDILPEKQLFEVVELKSFTTPLGFPIIHLTELNKLLQRIATSDVIYYIHSIPLLEILILLVSKARFGNRIIAVYEGPLQPQKLLLRFIRLFTARLLIKLGTCDGHHVLNEADKRLLRSFGAQNVRVIPNGVDLSLFELASDQESGLPFQVLFVGRLSHQKGFDIFCDVVQKVNSEISATEAIRFVVIGSGELEAMLQDLAKTHTNIEHLPHVAHVKMPGHFSGANLLVAPYRYEGQPLAVLEAQACGLPVVATALPGIREAIVNNETGIVVSSGKAVDFVEPILNYYRMWSEDQVRYSTVRAKAREHSLRFSWDNITDRIVSFIEDIMAEV